MYEASVTKWCRPQVDQCQGQNAIGHRTGARTSNLRRAGNPVSIMISEPILVMFIPAELRFMIFYHAYLKQKSCRADFRFQLRHALARQKTLFDNINIDWNLSHDDGSTDFSDDDTIIEDRVSSSLFRDILQEVDEMVSGRQVRSVS